MDTSKVLTSLSSDTQNLNSWDKMLLQVLKRVSGGNIRLRFSNGCLVELGDGEGAAVDVTMQNAGLSRRWLSGGAMAFAETYVEGLWTTSDLSGLLRILGTSQQRLGRFARGTSLLFRTVDRWTHRLRRNTRQNARKNIQEHYDLSNEMYTTFLDESMTYSAGIFSEARDTLESAQMRKLDRLIDGLGIQSDDHVLEIGSGWGSCAIRMATQTGCKVTSLTLSERQADEARARVAAAGLTDSVDIRLQDYRDVTETFDHAISIEMIEAVGHDFLPGYFNAVHQYLKPGGRFALQAITIPDDRYRAYNASCDFIRKHIFPGGHLPCPGQLQTLAEDKTGFIKEDEFEFGTDYAETLRRWTYNFFARLNDIKDLGFDDQFIRKWHYYLAYCEAGFDSDLIHVRQLTYRKPA